MSIAILQSIPYQVLAFCSILVLGIVHLYAYRLKNIDFFFKSKFLSAGGGIAIAYVFIDLLPKLSIGDALVSENLKEIFPYFERHVYLMALLGFLLFFLVDRAQKNEDTNSLILSFLSYTLFNFLMGYAIADPNNQEVQPLFLFTLAMGLHYFTNDYSLTEAHENEYITYGRFALFVSLFLGWLIGLFFDLSETAIALVSAFIGGGVIMNVLRHELPEQNPNNQGSFLIFCALYTMILLFMHQ